jgi:hypothetical protein
MEAMQRMVYTLLSISSFSVYHVSQDNNVFATEPTYFVFI